MSTISPLTGTLSGGSFYGYRHNSRTNRFPSEDSQTRNLNTTGHRDLCNSEIEFLDSQKSDIEKSYKTWMNGYLILMITASVSSVILMILWFQWIFKISSPSFVCAKLKHKVIWISLNYLLGLLFQTIGVASAYRKSIKGFIVYDILSLISAFYGVFLGVKTINKADDTLEGCISEEFESDYAGVHYYIYLTMMYCTVILMLVAVTIIMMHYLRKNNKAQAKYQEYLVK